MRKEATFFSLFFSSYCCFFFFLTFKGLLQLQHFCYVADLLVFSVSGCSLDIRCVNLGFFNVKQFWSSLCLFCLDVRIKDISNGRSE